MYIWLLHHLSTEDEWKCAVGQDSHKNILPNRRVTVQFINVADIMTTH